MARIYKPKKGSEDDVSHFDGSPPIHHASASQDQLKMLHERGVASIEYEEIWSRIKIQNFGPIKEGYQENDGYMDIKKVTVFIGDQGSGKSTVAKVISTLTWLEKAVNRGDVDRDSMNYFKFYDFFDYQRIKNYFKEDTLIDYQGEYVSILYDKKKLHAPEITFKKNSKYRVPKIMYVPSERNFLSVIEKANDVKRLPGTLSDFGDELKNGQIEFSDKKILLPINDVYYKYNKKNDSSFLIGKDYELNLLEGSSGFQSLVPLFLVSKFLTQELSKGNKILREQLSVNQSIRRNEEISKVMLDDQLADDEKNKKVKEIDAKYLNICFINIVEEPEQNLFPKSQRNILNSLLEFNNMNDGNKLILTTHSPYLINYLTLAIKADALHDKVKTADAKKKLFKVVPSNATVKSNEYTIYELNEVDGTIKLLENYKGLPSDENYLNERLGETNELFAQLLEIQQGL